MRPLIGITTSVNRRDYETRDQAVVMLPHNYPEAIRRAGGMPVLIPEGEVADSLLDSLDGIVISGGRDISPDLYDEEVHAKTVDVRPEQDISELALMRVALERDLPLLAVCRGHQLYCVEHGGRLHQHLPETPGFEQHGATDGEWSEHGVHIEADSKLASIIGTRISGNSGHHQGVADAGDLHVVGRTEDGLIEAVEDSSKKFCISVQWHPEMIGQHEIFDALIEAARS
ncbi:MAG: gamma-glutamyl-gamma-aminobutyrate hydrolase family protein [Candidatus Thalassarchaeaceae archaeon]|nr:gamma-glutamyl-gamma-aminobutyrate hydrolase family protein [Candidatus Thalassarchaeaceae archaeon]